MNETRTPTLDELLGQERWLRALARRLVRDAATADDLVQETWFRALRAGGGQGGAGDARAWLGRVLRNVWRERGRSERTRGRREAHAAAAEALPSARESLERVELARRLAAMVLELDEPYRSVLVWRYYEGRSAAAIAAALGEPATRVRWRLMRARELLRQRLERERRDWVAHYALFLPLARRPAAAAATGAGATGIGAFSLGAKLLAGACAAALLLWTVVELRAPSAPDPVTSAGKSVLVATEPDGNEELVASEHGGQRAPQAASEAPPPARAEAAASSADPSARLSGVVRATEGGAALAGAEVALFTEGGRAIRHRTVADGSGGFHFEELEPGTYDVAGRAEGRLPVRRSALALAEGSETEITLELARGFSVAVEVVERGSAAPVAAAEVELVPGDKDTVVWFSDDDLAFRSLAGVTAPDGRVVLGGAERGVYQYIVRAPRHAPALGEVLLDPDGAPLRIALERGGAVQGSVWRADGAPAEGARVFLNPARYLEGLSERIFRQNGLAADRDGHYRLEGVPAGLYHAVALLPDGSGAFHLDPDRPSERKLGLVVVEDAAEVALDFRLPASGEVRGRVLAPDGTPIAGARVTVSWGDFKPPAAGFFPIAEVAGVKESIHHTTSTDADGRFVLANLRASYEPLELRVSASGHVGTEVELDVPPGARLEPVLTLQTLGAWIRGRLTDVQGAPIAGQNVGAFESDGEKLGAFFQTTSGADGDYELVVASAAGARHRVQPILRDKDPFSCQPAVREGVAAGASGIDFVLHAKRRLHGSVVDDAGLLVRDFVVHALEQGKTEWEARTDGNRGDGRFEVFVEPTVAELRFSAPGCDPAALTDLARDSEQRVVLRRAGDLEGVVLDAAGYGVEGAVVALATLDSAVYPRGTGFAPRATTDSAGRFLLRGVPDPAVLNGPVAQPGHLLVCPRRDDAPPLLHYPLPVLRGGRLELVLPRSVPVELVFTEANGRPIEGGLLLFDGAGWPLEPALETHLADQESDTRGVLVAGRTRFQLVPGSHHALLVRGIELEQPLPFEVSDPGPGEAELQTRSFTVADAR